MTIDTFFELREQIDKKDVVLFCGMDLSASEGGLPTSVQLAKDLALRAGIKDIDRLILPEIAERYRVSTGLGYHSLISYIANRIDQPNYNPLPVHQLISSLPFAAIITTTWDNLLEVALREANHPFTKIVVDDEVAYMSGDKLSLIKLRGSIERKDSLVITDDDYYDVLLKHSQIANLVGNLFATKTVLFLGFDLQGEDFKRLYHSVTHKLAQHKRQAYAVQQHLDPYMVAYWQTKGMQIILAEPLVFLRKILEESTIGDFTASSPAKNVIPIESPIILSEDKPQFDPENTDLVQLITMINNHFNQEELNTLCFHLSIEYDDLGGEGRASKARELVKLLNRHNRLTELMVLAKRLRPRVDWEIASGRPNKDS